MKAIKLSQWAKENGYTYQGAYEMFARGQLPQAYKLPSGSIRVPVDDVAVLAKCPMTVIYARVSTPKQRDDLTRQVESISGFCAANGWVIDRVYKETASGLNDNRPQLNKLLDNPDITRVVVSNKDRMTRFGFNYLKKLLEIRGCELVVVNHADTAQDDLMQDFVSVITSMAARVYGLRRHKSHVAKIIKDVTEK